MENRDKGVTEVISVMLLIGIAVSVAGSYYATQTSIMDSITEGLNGEEAGAEFQDFEFAIENCWEEDNTGYITVRNQANEEVSTNGLRLYINGVNQENPEISRETVPAQATFQVQFTEGEQPQITLTSGGSEESHTCSNVQLEPITDPDPIEPASTINEGGDTTSTLQWGTTGSVSIITPNPEFPDTPDTFCIGDQCTQSTGNQPVETTHGDYLNRRYGEINGTITVEQTINTGTDGDLCIGSECSPTPGDAHEEEFYGLDEEGDGPMDGPIEFRGQAGDDRGLILQSGTCIGSHC